MEVKFCILKFSSFAGLCFLCQVYAVSSVTSTRHKRSNCGANLFGETGIIESPNYPNSYPSYVTCVWYITVPERSRIILSFQGFDLEAGISCDYDYLEIHDGDKFKSDVLAKLCGSDLPPPIESSGNQMTLTFRSDVSTEGSGFRAEFQKVTDCGGELTSEEGNVFSPMYPNKYGKNHDCVWIITGAKNDRVMLRFRSFQLERSPGCTKDFVEIRDGSDLRSPRLGIFCGSDLPQEIRSSRNNVIIRFKTNDRDENRGFSVHFMKVQPVLPVQSPIQRPISMAIRNLPGFITTGIALFLLNNVLLYHMSCEIFN